MFAARSRGQGNTHSRIKRPGPLVGRAARVEVRLQQDLRRDAIAPLLALTMCQAGRPEGGLRLRRREALVEEYGRQPRGFREPPAESARLSRLLPLAAVGVQRQADDEPADVFALDQLAEVGGVLVAAAPVVR